MSDETPNQGITLNLKMPSRKVLIAIAVVVVVGVSLFFGLRTTSSNNPLAKAYALQGISAFKDKDYGLCVTLFTQEIEAAGNDSQRATGHYNRGTAEVRLSQTTQAIADFQQATTLVKTFQVAWLNLGLTHQNLGHRVAALAALNTALKLNPNDVTALINSGVLMYRGGDTTGGLARLHKSVELSPEAVSRIPKDIVL
jgi:Flp pilus assembly protein TadD